MPPPSISDSVTIVDNVVFSLFSVGNDTLPQNKVGVVDFANAQGLVIF